MGAEVKRVLINGIIAIIFGSLVGFAVSFAIVAGIAWVVGAIFGVAINYAIIATVLGILYVLYIVSVIVMLTIEARS